MEFTAKIKALGYSVERDGEVQTVKLKDVTISADVEIPNVSEEELNKIREYFDKLAPAKNARGAGRTKKRTLIDGHVCCYSDVLKLIKSDMPAADIMDLLELPPRTYYRRLKSMRESEYMKAVVEAESCEDEAAREATLQFARILDYPF